MRFTVSQSSLADALAIVQKGIASASTLPILSGVLIKAEDGVLESKQATTPSLFVIVLPPVWMSLVAWLFPARCSPVLQRRFPTHQLTLLWKIDRFLSPAPRAPLG